MMTPPKFREVVEDTLIQSLDPVTPTDQPTDATQPMAPARTTNGATSLAYTSPGSWHSPGSQHNHTRRVLTWGAAGGSNGHGGMPDDLDIGV